MMRRDAVNTENTEDTTADNAKGGGENAEWAEDEEHTDEDGENAVEDGNHAETADGAGEADTEDEETEVAAREGGGPCVLGIVADPDMPTQIGTSLSEEATNWLDEHAGGEWTIEVVSDPVTAGEGDREELFDALENYRSERGWLYTICLTDLPLLLRQRPLIADVSPSRRVGVVSLPALGGAQPYRRMRQMLLQLLEELLNEGQQRSSSTGQHRLYSWLTNLLAPVHRTSAPEDAAVRYTANRWSGWFRLLSGMVRTNRPWRLVFGLSSALAAAIATSAFGLSSSTIWQIADTISPIRQVLGVFFSVALLVIWLITAHGLWERSRNRTQGFRRLARLYNSSTVVTLTIGVGCLYLGLLVINLGVASFLVPVSVLTDTLQAPVTPNTYFNLAWGFTTMGTIAGALGSNFESDSDVRQAAYGYREEQRRKQEKSQ